MNAIGRIIFMDNFDNVLMKNQNFGRCNKSKLSKETILKTNFRFLFQTFLCLKLTIKQCPSYKLTYIEIKKKKILVLYCIVYLAKQKLFPCFITL